MALTEEWKIELDIHKVVGVLSTDMWSKVLRVARRGPHNAFGPLIWNIFQNDLTYVVNSSLNMYADDHQFYTSGGNVLEVRKKINELCRISD